MKNSLNKKGHIGIVEKVQETSSNTGIYDTVCMPLLYCMNAGCRTHLHHTV